MDVHDVFPLPPRRSQSNLVHIITQLLELEMKLSRLDDQSEYFKWALENHYTHLKNLHRQYENFRYRFNTADNFRDELNDYGEILGRVNSSLAAGIIRGIAISALQFKVDDIEGMMAMKGVVDQLPEFDQLRTMHEVLSDLLDMA
jgi:hypothetical protein